MDRPALHRLAGLLEERLVSNPAARTLVRAVGEALVEVASLAEGSAVSTAEPSVGSEPASTLEGPALEESALERPDSETEDVENGADRNPDGGAAEPREPLAERREAMTAASDAQMSDRRPPVFTVSSADLAAAASSARAKAGHVAAVHPSATDVQRRHLAGAYGALAAAADLVVAIGDGDHETLQRAIELSAEAQSGLRVAFLAAKGFDASATPPSASIEEPDGHAVFRWLAEATSIYGVYVRDYMKWTAPADPARAPTLCREIKHLAAQAGLATAPMAPTDRLEKALKAVRDRAGRIERGDGSPESNWPRLLADLAKAVRAGLAESAVELREALLPIVDAWPDDAEAPAEAARVRREIERYLASRPDNDDEPDDASFSEEVAELAGLLRGSSVALFGGVPKPHVVERVREAFGLADVVWEETREHQSTEPFRSVVARPDVALVVLFIRWCSHSFEDLKAYCDDAGAPYVRMKAGNHPNRIAHAVLAQVGERLRAAA